MALIFKLFISFISAFYWPGAILRIRRVSPRKVGCPQRGSPSLARALARSHGHTPISKRQIKQTLIWPHFDYESQKVNEWEREVSILIARERERARR